MPKELDVRPGVRVSVSEIEARLWHRFWEKIETSGNGCWNWVGSKNRQNHGSFWYEGRQMMAHRVAWIMHTGVEPDGMVIHTCGNNSCVNPQHLVVGDVRKKHEIAKSLNIGFVKRDSSGANHPQAKLTLEQVEEIKELHATSNLTTNQIGDRYGITQQQVCKIGQGLRWRKP